MRYLILFIGDLWGGIVRHHISSIPLQISALVNFTNRFVDDPLASVVGIWQYSSDIERLEAATGIQYAQPVEEPPIFREICRIGESNTTRFADIHDLMMETAPPPGRRVLLLSLTFKNDARVVHKILEEQGEVIENAKAHVRGDSWNVVSFLQPFPAFFGKLSTKNLGNVLGLENMGNNHLCKSAEQISLVWPN